MDRGREESAHPTSLPPKEKSVTQEYYLRVVDELRERGVCVLPWRADVGGAVEWLGGRPVHPGPHVLTMAPGFSGYRPEDVVRGPGLLDLFNDARILSVVEGWLGLAPCLYSVNAWWSHAGGEAQLWHAQHFHRDTDAARFLVLFVYLTAVDKSSGPFQIVTGTHHAGPSGQGAEFSGRVERDYGDRIFSAVGPAGTLVLADTRALHRGLVPRSRDRLVAWARYGEGSNSNSADLEMAPVPAGEVPTAMVGTGRERHINRLLVDWGEKK